MNELEKQLKDAYKKLSTPSERLEDLMDTLEARLEVLKPELLKGKDAVIDENKIVREVLKQIPSANIPVKGVDYFDGEKGKDAVIDYEIVTKEILGEIKKKKTDLSIFDLKDWESLYRSPGNVIGQSGISNITGLIQQGTNVTITGSGTKSDPYIINSTGGGGGGLAIGTTVTGGTPNRVLYENNSAQLSNKDTFGYFDGSGLLTNIALGTQPIVNGLSGFNPSFILGDFSTSSSAQIGITGANANSSIVFGFSDATSGGEILSTEKAVLAFGVVGNDGVIHGNTSGSFVHGKAITGGNLSADGVASEVSGLANGVGSASGTSSKIQTLGDGAKALGLAEVGGQIVSGSYGTNVWGHSSGEDTTNLFTSQIGAFSDGATAFGSAQTGGQILSQGQGAFAYGLATGSYADINTQSTIVTNGDATTAFGYVTDGGQIQNSSTASFIFGTAAGYDAGTGFVSTLNATADNGFVFGNVQAGGLLHSNALASMVFGSAYGTNGTIRSEITVNSDFSFAYGYAVNGGTIKTQGQSSWASGMSDNGIIYTGGNASMVRGIVESLGSLYANGAMSQVFGYATSNGYLSGAANCTLVFGTALNNGGIASNGDNSLAFGVANNSLIQSNSNSLSFGNAVNPNGSIISGDSGLTFGYVDTGSIFTSYQSGLAFGDAENYEEIGTSGPGGFAGGVAISGSIIAGSGSFAFGNAAYGNIFASGAGSITMGSGIDNNADFATCFGINYTNNDSSTFNVGYNAIAFQVDASNDVKFPLLALGTYEIATIDGTGIVSKGGQRGQFTQVQYETPSTGASIVSNGAPQLILNPVGGTIASITITFPASPLPGQLFGISTTQTITTVALAGGAIYGQITTLGASGFANWVYSGDLSSWIRK